MHIASLAQILLWITAYKYWIIFPLAVIEGPIITVLAAFLASQGIIDVVTLFLVVVLGDIVGDIIHYAFGRWLYAYVLVHYEKRFRKMGEAVENIIGYLRENPGKTILFGKWSHVANFPILIASWAARLPLLQFFGYCMLGTIPKIIVLIIIGYTSGSAYAQIDSYMGKVFFFVFLLIVAIGVFFYLRNSAKWTK